MDDSKKQQRIRANNAILKMVKEPWPGMFGKFTETGVYMPTSTLEPLAILLAYKVDLALAEQHVAAAKTNTLLYSQALVFDVSNSAISLEAAILKELYIIGNIHVETNTTHSFRTDDMTPLLSERDLLLFAKATNPTKYNIIGMEIRSPPTMYIIGQLNRMPGYIDHPLFVLFVHQMYLAYLERINEILPRYFSMMKLRRLQASTQLTNVRSMVSVLVYNFWYCFNTIAKEMLDTHFDGSMYDVAIFDMYKYTFTWLMIPLMYISGADNVRFYMLLQEIRNHKNKYALHSRHNSPMQPENLGSIGEYTRDKQNEVSQVMELAEESDVSVAVNPDLSLEIIRDTPATTPNLESAPQEGEESAMDGVINLESTSDLEQAPLVVHDAFLDAVWSMENIQ